MPYLRHFLEWVLEAQASKWSQRTPELQLNVLKEEQKRKPGLDKDQRLLTLHDFTLPITLYAQLKVYKLPLKIKLRALLKAWSPHVILSCFLFSPLLLCSSFRVTDQSMGPL